MKKLILIFSVLFFLSCEKEINSKKQVEDDCECGTITSLYIAKTAQHGYTDRRVYVIRECDGTYTELNGEMTTSPQAYSIGEKYCD